MFFKRKNTIIFITAWNKTKSFHSDILFIYATFVTGFTISKKLQLDICINSGCF